MFGGSPDPNNHGALPLFMALVRCSCVVDLVASANGRIALDVTVLDPACGYVVHRLFADLLTASEPDIQAS
jgi:hypothetical protein